MKNKYILLVATILILTLIACKKDNNKTPVIGKWQQTKLRVYMLSPAGTILNDTTYSGQTFTSMDYIQFNSGNTCVVSGSHDYYPAGQVYYLPPKVDISEGTLDYVAIKSGYILRSISNVTNPGPFSSADTVTMHTANSLFRHLVNYTVDGPTTVYDSYYTR